MYPSRKAQATLMVILLVVVGFFVIMVVSRAIVMLRGVQVMNILELEVQITDEGGTLVSLLSSGDENRTRMEVLGTLFFAELDDEKKGIEGVLKGELGSYLALVNSTGDTVKAIGTEKEGRKFDAEVPLPGGGDIYVGARETVRMVS